MIEHQQIILQIEHQQIVEIHHLLQQDILIKIIIVQIHQLEIIHQSQLIIDLLQVLVLMDHTLLGHLRLHQDLPQVVHQAEVVLEGS